MEYSIIYLDGQTDYFYKVKLFDNHLGELNRLSNY